MINKLAVALKVEYYQLFIDYDAFEASKIKDTIVKSIQETVHKAIEKNVNKILSNLIYNR